MLYSSKHSLQMNEKKTFYHLKGNLLMNQRLTWSLTFALGLMPLTSFAQTPPDAGSLLRDMPEVPAEAQPLPGRHQLPPPLPDTGMRIELQRIEFEGYKSMATKAELQAVVADALGQSVGFNGLQHLADRITQHLKDKGYFLAFAYLPEQDISDGILKILIQPGRVDGSGYWQPLEAEQPINISNRRIDKTLNRHLRPSDSTPVHTLRMERGLLLINDLSGISGQADLQAGEELGTTRVNLRLRPTPRYTGNIWADNYGNRYTGEARVNALGNINNLSGMGDQLTGMVSLTEWMKFSRLSYTSPIGYTGLTGELATSFMTYELGKELESLNYDGQAITLSGSLNYPIIRSRLNNLYVQGGYEFKDLEDDEAGNTRERTYHSLTLSLDGDRLDQIFGGGLINYGFSLTQGDLSHKQNPDLDGQFSKLNFNFSRLQRVTDRTSLLLRTSGQYAFDNLDSSEQFSVGGSNSVRAYPGGEISGDHGWLTTLEARYDLLGFQLGGGNLQLNAFYDVGGVTLNRDDSSSAAISNTNANNTPVIMGAGFGASLTRAQVFSVRTSVAFKLNDEIEDRRITALSEKDADGKSRDPRLWVQSMLWF